VVETIEGGTMTGDLARIAEPAPTQVASTVEFIEAIEQRLQHKLG
jgi:isocitrate dehydrogenase